MEIILNGKAHPISREMTIQELVEGLGFTGKRIAVERNAEIVPRSRHATTPLAPGDRIEIVVAVGGG
jgi:sulfur carrier protein